MSQNCAVMWFREDLRVEDNSALFSACQNHRNIIAIYIIDPEAWCLHDMAPCRADFILRNLAELKKSLAKFNIPLLIFEIQQTAKFPEFVVDLLESLNAEALYFNDQYELDESRRDQKITQLCGQKNIEVKHFTDQVIFGPGEILTQKSEPYTVFTPYKKTFIKRWDMVGGVKPLPPLKFLQNFALVFSLSEKWRATVIYHQDIPTSINGFESTIPEKYWPAGENAAHDRLKKFVTEKIIDYKNKRDFPAQHGTSVVSPYLSNGILSPRQCFAAAVAANKGRIAGGFEGIDCWISELIWREFYKQILWSFPRVSMGTAFKVETDKIQWSYDQAIFQAWCEGRTGYPIVDAAMRQLNQTGWMHNRLRMIVAMFLTKDCFIDWRLGEKYFAQHLIDHDLASNNGGWQWSASTGTDAAPYFRIFNPILQSEKFDPQGVFIKHYCPELKDLPADLIHDPSKLPADIDYPKPIIDRKDSKARVIAAFKGL